MTCSQWHAHGIGRSTVINVIKHRLHNKWSIQLTVKCHIHIITSQCLNLMIQNGGGDKRLKKTQLYPYQSTLLVLTITLVVVCYTSPTITVFVYSGDVFNTNFGERKRLSFCGFCILCCISIWMMKLATLFQNEQTLDLETFLRM